MLSKEAPGSILVPGDKMVVPKTDFFENRFGILSSQVFQKYKFHFCCQHFVWTDTGGHCDPCLLQTDLTKFISLRLDIALYNSVHVK